MLLKRALFLDRDGVINHDTGYTFAIKDFVFIDGIFELCHAALKSGYLLIVVTNQAGIARGYFSEQDFLNLTNWMQDRFVEKGILITEVLYCPYHPEHGLGEFRKDSFDRKPNPGMLLRAAEMHGINLENSIIIGDKDSDMQAGHKAGIGIRCHYLTNEHACSKSSAATHSIKSLLEGVSFF